MIGEFIGKIGAWLIDLISTTGYIGIFIAMAIESCLVPLPSEITMPFAGALAAQGKLSLIPTILAGALGNLVGSLAAYYIGVLTGENVIRRFIRKWGKFLLISERKYDKALKLTYRYGSIISFTGRLLPGIRTIISLPAGIARVNLIPFIFYTFTGSLIWSAALTAIGYKMGENWEQIQPYFHKFSALIVIGLIACFALYVFLSFRPRKDTEKADQ